MNNINLEKFIYNDLHNKGYNFYCSKTYKIKNVSYAPQIYAIKDITKQLLKQKLLRLIDFSTQKTHNFIHKRPLIVLKSLSSNLVSDNTLLCSILKQGVLQIPSKDIVGSLDKYLLNIQPLSLVENVFSTSLDKISYLKIFSKIMTLQNTHFKNLDLFFNKHTSEQEKKDFLVWFISKRSKELDSIHIDKKVTTYLMNTWNHDRYFLQNFLSLSPFLSNQIQNKDLDIFDDYQQSITIKANILDASQILGLTTNKISLASEKLFRAIEKYYHANLTILNEKNSTTFLLEHNDHNLTKQSIQDTYKYFLTQLSNTTQKIDSNYCEKWYLKEVISNKLPSKNITTKVIKI